MITTQFSQHMQDKTDKLPVFQRLWRCIKKPTHIIQCHIMTKYQPLVPHPCLNHEKKNVRMENCGRHMTQQSCDQEEMGSSHLTKNKLN